MTILLVGGGSGGHITPLLAVAKQLKIDHPKTRVIAMSEKRGVFNGLFDGENQIDKLYFISAGKYRRYHGQNLAAKLLDIKTLILNIGDVFKFIAGIFQSIIILRKEKPDVIFVKGGYVGVPAGLAAKLLKIPYITHDSDAIPGLTNRLIGKKAIYNAVGMPPEFYAYPKEKIVYVGVPVTDDFINPDEDFRAKKRHELDISRAEFMILITGGSNGAKKLDYIVHACLLDLLEKYPKLNVVHQVGKNNQKLYEDYPARLHARIRVASFLKPLSTYVAAADVVIARAGATAIAEIGHMNTALVVVPNPYLAGGHQTKNASVLAAAGAAVVVDEVEARTDPKLLADAIESLINNHEKRNNLSSKLHKMTQKDAAQKLSNLLTEAAKVRAHPRINSEGKQ